MHGIASPPPHCPFAGECLGRFTTGKVPHCLAFNPAPDKQNMFIAGMNDKKIVQVMH